MSGRSKVAAGGALAGVLAAALVVPLVVATSGPSPSAAGRPGRALETRPASSKARSSAVTGARELRVGNGDPIVSMASTPSGQGYWLAGSDGGVFSFGDAQFYGSMGGLQLNRPVVGMAATPSGHGYWLVAADGGIFTFGDARFFGSTGAIRLNQPIVAMSATPSGGGYRLVAADGGVFDFGDARFYGSMGAVHLNRPVVGMAASPSGHGYWLVAADGGIFTFGDARFYGSLGGVALNQPVTVMSMTPGGGGYWLVAADGGIFTYGNAGFYGSLASFAPDRPVFATAAVPSGGGYWMATSDGTVFSFGSARFHGSAVPAGPVRVALYGDSLSSQAGPFYDFALTASGRAVVDDHAYGGTSICSWFDQMRQDAATFRPEAIVLQFSGDAFAPCMGGVTPGTPPYYAKYQADAETAIAIAASIGARVYLVSYPVSLQTESQPYWDELNQTFQSVAATSPDASYVDAAAAVESNGQFTMTLPCLYFEPCTGPVVLGVPSNLVRDPSGSHFCPTGNFTLVGQFGYCDVWSSGAFRYGTAMASGVVHDFGL